MKGTKSAAKKVDLTTVTGALKKEALKAKLPKGKATKKTKSAKSWLGNTARISASDPEMAEGSEYKGRKKDLKKILGTTKSAEKEVGTSLETLKGKMKKRK